MADAPRAALDVSARGGPQTPLPLPGLWTPEGAAAPAPGTAAKWPCPLTASGRARSAVPTHRPGHPGGTAGPRARWRGAQPSRQPVLCLSRLRHRPQATGHAKRGPQQLRDGSRKPGPGQAARGRTDLSTATCRLPPGTGHGPLAQGPPSTSRGEPPDHAVRAVQPARSHGPGTGRAHLCLARGCLSRASTQLRPVSPAPLRGTACTPHVELASPGTAGLCPRLTRQPRQARHLRTHTPREGSRTRQSELAGTRHPEVGCGPNREKPRRAGLGVGRPGAAPRGPQPA